MKLAEADIFEVNDVLHVRWPAAEADVSAVAGLVGALCYVSTARGNTIAFRVAFATRAIFPIPNTGSETRYKDLRSGVV